jgi:peroxiredoxin
MKKLSIIVVAVLAVVSCKEKNKDQTNASKLTIKGTVTIPDSLKGKTDTSFVVLREVGDSSIKAIDSVKLASDGTFNFSIPSTEKAFYYVEILKRKSVFVVGGPNENLEVVVKGLGVTDDFDINGSKDNQDMKKTAAFLNTFNIQSSNYQKEYKVLVQTNQKAASEKMLQTMDSAYNSSVAEAKKMIRSFGATLPAMSFAANFISPKRDIVFLDSIAQLIVKEMPNSKYAKNFQTFVENNKVLNIGSQAPDITASTPDNQWVKLSDFKGKYVLLDFWASWCKPCRQESQNVVRLYNKYKDKGFTVLSFSLDDNKEAWMKAIKDDHLTWTHISELKKWNSSVVSSYKIEGIPATYLLDKEGKILAMNLRGEELEAKIAEILK